ncbi:hypothetical protein CK203_061519 [Vitis vinifera]|uniref:Uncharacterized protein n=1 Tax=Vitis vinifera TaxID=29760 RepID=A0A438GTC1_VITVI|nr:hypothetical protein CK203_061519 [Vitis vinifera]
MEPYQEEASIGRPPFLIGEIILIGNENNARAMYSIFNAISTDGFCRIATCTSVKEGWDILQVTHEGTNAMKVSKLQMLTSRKSKGIALNAIKEESLGSEDEGDEKMSDGEVARFARNFKKHMKFRIRKYKKKPKEDVEKWNNSMGKSNCEGNGHYAIECPSKKKGNKAMQVTWIDTESCQSSEKESNASEECTNSQPLWQVSLRNHSRKRSFFTNFFEFDGGNVTFGDDNVASVKEKGTICAPDIPNLEEAEAINTAFYTSNRIHMHPHTRKTCYELWKGKKPIVKYFRVLKDHENLGKFDSRVKNGYS